MPPRSELPGSIHRISFLRALVRLGFEIDEKGGDGSHCKATWPPTQQCVTIQQRLDKDVLYYLLKEIERHSGITWEEIQKEMSFFDANPKYQKASLGETPLTLRWG
jgi:hypothetical protein